MNLRDFSNKELRTRTQTIAGNERKCTTWVVAHIAEVDRRSAYLEWNYSNLYDYVTKELRYSEGSANRRILAARALRQMPELKEEIASGAVNLSQIVATQVNIRKEEKTTGRRIDLEKKKAIYESLKNKNGVETQKILDAHLPVHTPTVPVIEHHRRDDSIDLHLRIPKELADKLQRVKEVYSHIQPNGDWIQVLELMASDVLLKRDPLAKPTSTPTQCLATAELKRPVISVGLRRFVFHRDKGQCQHKHNDGSICGSRFQTQCDHIIPIFAGGTSVPENLRLLCRHHNLSRYKNGTGTHPLD